MSEWRYIATRPDGAGGEKVLHWDVPLEGALVTNTLSGPDLIRGTITPEVAGLLAPDGRRVLERWGTCLYAEQNGVIRAGSIVTDLSYKGQALGVEGTGFAGYPQGMAYTGGTTHFRNADPAAICEALWAHMQSKRGGNLGVSVDFGSTPVRTGAKTTSETTAPRDQQSGRYVPTDEPTALTVSYEVTPDIGQLIDSLASSTPFDYVESHAWSGDKIKHSIRSTYPQIGRRRTDLRFVEGENVYVTPDITESGDDYASEVFVLGAGEGGRRIKMFKARSDEVRLRRAITVTDRSIRDPSAAMHVATGTLRRMSGAIDVSELLLLDHPNAPIGAVSLGDEVPFVMGPSGWKAGLEVWLRVTSITYNPESPERAALTVEAVI